MADIILSTLNAKFIHAAFGLRYLQANLAELQPRSRLLEFDIHQKPVEIAEAILAESPRIIGLGIHVWNVAPATDLVRLLKHLRPDVTLVLGGPEVSYPDDLPPVARQADYIIAGEAEVAFAQLCRDLLQGRPPNERFLRAAPAKLDTLAPPYPLYCDSDFEHRIVYLETSRGCPFKCEFCLSALDPSVRLFPIETLLDQFRSLWDRGCRRFKFVDRSFNVSRSHYQRILEFFLDRVSPNTQLHFEIIPDLLTPDQIELAGRFPPGILQFEVGVQTLDPVVAERIGRRQDNGRLEANLSCLRQHTGVHLHADLIAGLPGESVEGFAAGFDRLVALDPQEIQLGILKRLRGSMIQRHNQEWAMVYDPCPPYEIMQTRLIDFFSMQRIKRLARYWDLIANSGNFRLTHRRLWSKDTSPFHSLLKFSDWLYQQLGRRHGIALGTLMESLFIYLTRIMGQTPAEIAALLVEDQQRCGRNESPPFLKPYLPTPSTRLSLRQRPGYKRQQRHGD
jgi:radical SAM superfamily enzyme YgiQ (UPF0313 family)